MANQVCLVRLSLSLIHISMCIRDRIRAGANSTDVTIAVRALARVIDISDIKKDDQLTIFLRQDGNLKRLLGFNLASSAQKSITVSRTVDGNYKARELSTSFKRRTLRICLLYTSRCV